MTPAEKIAENRKKVRAWFRNIHAKRDDRLDEETFRQRAFLNRKKRRRAIL